LIESKHTGAISQAAFNSFAQALLLSGDAPADGKIATIGRGVS
jgi:hypothetical protein